MAETAKLVNRIREISESLLCRDGVGHYCPNCDGTTFEAAMSLKLLADQIVWPVETDSQPVATTGATYTGEASDLPAKASRPLGLLLAIADYLDEQIDALVGCHTTPDTNDTDPEVMDEVTEVRGWIAQLRGSQQETGAEHAEK